MDLPENQELRKLIQQFHVNTQLRYSGKLEIKSSKNHTWILYYQFGQLVWATGGTHPNRRWLRNINQICPHLDITQIKFNEPIISADHWDYLLLLKLYNDNIIQPEQFNKFVINSLKEIFFDIYQNLYDATLTFERDTDIVLEIKVIPASSRTLLKQVKEEWNQWNEIGLATISPHLSPILVQSENVNQETEFSIFKQFHKAINGKHTLYDLAVKNQQSILEIMLSLLPHIMKGNIKFQEVADISLVAHKLSPVYANHGKVPLIACVDDSVNFCKLLDRIITSHGMNFISVNDSVQAIPHLLASKPDFIFLDLVMPILNGYELCAQLRCTSVFANTPIVILTSSTGVFDQARAKAFGATDFLNKYITRDTLLHAINKHLQLEIHDDLEQLVS
ncbi:MAG: response regulator [Nostocales cyanobacterium]|nr:MAG: response regulator [Nostocales cyanobacterium]TAF15476.1 MAG: response regulator [Nostocales cyanobacterium]